MKSIQTISIFVILLILPAFSFGQSAMEKSVEKKYGEMAVQKLKTMQYPGKLYPGISQERNEENDEATIKTQQMTVDGIEQEKSQKTIEIMESAVESYRNGMKDWAAGNTDIKALEPLKSISKQ